MTKKKQNTVDNKLPTDQDNPDTINPRAIERETEHQKFCQTCMGKGVNTAVSDTELCKDCNGSGMVAA